MTNEPDPDSWQQTAVRVIAVSGVEVLLSSVGAPGLAAGAGIIIEHLVERRRRAGEKHIEMVAADVGGQSELLNAIASNDERNELLWSSVQAAMTSGSEGKRIYLARVVAQAMTGDSAAIDDARLIVDALAVLDGPHIRALAKLRAADDEWRLADRTGELLGDAAAVEPEPVLATLVRTGVVNVGPWESTTTTGLVLINGPRSYMISGVSDFGRRLLADLESVVIN